MSQPAPDSAAPHPDPFRLDGMTAVVTGSSRGIGRAIALEMAKAGANVYIHARQCQQAAAETAEHVRQLGRMSTFCLADLAMPAEQDRLVEQAWAWESKVDIWVNNAGADVLTGEAASWSFEQKLEQLWAVDVLGSLRLSRAIGEKMRQRGSGVILNMGWDQAEQGMAGDAGQMFGTIKGAVIAFSRSLAQTLAPYVRVHCLAPGWIRTAWGEQTSDYWNERAKRESLAGRWGEPADIAQAARFLASPAATFLNGQVIPVNGGFRLGQLRDD